MGTRIDGNQIYNYDTSYNGASAAGNSSNSCIWDSYQAEKAEAQAALFDPKKVAKDLEKAIKNKDFNTFKSIINTTPQNKIQHLMNEYRMNTDISILDALNKEFKDKAGAKEIETMLRSFGSGTYAHAEILAHDLMKELNGNDTEKIEALMKELKDLPPSRVKEIYAFYQHRAIYTTQNESDMYKQEIAATDAEKKELGADADGFLEKIWNTLTYNYKRVKLGAKRPESLYQGILNNPALSLEKKREYLELVSNKMIKYAKEEGFSNTQIEKYEKSAKIQIQDATSYDSSVVNNSQGLEEDLADLLNSKKN